MFALPISKTRFKRNILYYNSPKIKLFFQKNTKFSIARALPLFLVPPDSDGEFLATRQLAYANDLTFKRGLNLICK